MLEGVFKEFPRDIQQVRTESIIVKKINGINYKNLTICLNRLIDD